MVDVVGGVGLDIVLFVIVVEVEHCVIGHSEEELGLGGGVEVFHQETYLVVP